MERRTFVKSLAFTAAGIGLSTRLMATPKKKALGIQLYTLRDALGKDVTGSLEKLSKLGYNEIELFGYNGTFFGKTAKEFSKLCSDLGLKPISSHYVTGRTTNATATLTNGWQKAVDDAAELKLEYMVCAWLPPAERTAELYKPLPDLLSSAAETCNKSNMQFCYHNHDFEFENVGGSMPYDLLLQQTDSKKVKMELDLYWVSKAGKDPVALFEANPGRFPLWHVKDKDRTSGAFAEVGSGDIDFDRIFAARKTAGLKHWFVEQDVCKGDPFDSIKMSRDYVQTKKW